MMHISWRRCVTAAALSAGDREMLSLFHFCVSVQAVNRKTLSVLCFCWFEAHSALLPPSDPFYLKEKGVCVWAESLNRCFFRELSIYMQKGRSDLIILTGCVLTLCCDVSASLITYTEQYMEYDSFLTAPEPSNPWTSDDPSLWDLEARY